MFYVKSRLSETCEVKVNIEDDNVYTTCPNCGVEFPVELEAAIFNEKFLDLYGVRIYCTKCSKKYQRNGEEG